MVKDPNRCIVFVLFLNILCKFRIYKSFVLIVFFLFDFCNGNAVHCIRLELCFGNTSVLKQSAEGEGQLRFVKCIHLMVGMGYWSEPYECNSNVAIVL